jgi:hypothetical protein
MDDSIQHASADAQAAKIIGELSMCVVELATKFEDELCKASDADILEVFLNQYPLLLLIRPAIRALDTDIERKQFLERVIIAAAGSLENLAPIGTIQDAVPRAAVLEIKALYRRSGDDEAGGARPLPPAPSEN